MRVTNQYIYYSNLFSHQQHSSTLNDLLQRINSGSKIQNSYEDASTYIDGVRLEYESILLNQVTQTTQKASEFSKNSDKALNSFVKKLEEFKTKLIQAANDIHDPTSREALANDLEGIRKNLIDIANTSINGQFIFAGTALDTKPVDNLGNYYGNDRNISAATGADQTQNYNIDGNTLFLGYDKDYQKVLTTNVSLMNNYEKLSTPPAERYLQADDPIYKLIGGNYESKEYQNKTGEMEQLKDFIPPYDGLTNTTFYMQGRKPDGTTFSTKFSVTPDTTAQNLLDRIGQAFGNTTDNKVVDVQLNNSGQIEVTDLRYGNQLTEFHIFGLTDQKGPETYKMGKYNISINSDPTQGGLDAAVTVNPVYDDDGNITALEVFHPNSAALSNRRYSLDANGNLTSNVAFTVNPPGSTNIVMNVNNQFTAIENLTEARYEAISRPVFRDVNGAVINRDPATGAITNDFTSANFTDLATIERNVQVTGSVHLTEFIQSDFRDILGVKSDATDYNKLQFEKKDNKITGNVSQIDKTTGLYATNATPLASVAGRELTSDATNNITANITSRNGQNYQVKINFVDNSGYPRLTINRTDADFNPIANGEVYNDNIDGGVYEAGAKTTNGVILGASDLTYQNLNDIISMVAADNIPDISLNTNQTLQTIEANTQIANITAATDLADLKARLTNGLNPNTQSDIINRINAQINEMARDKTITTFPIDNQVATEMSDLIRTTERFHIVNDGIKSSSNFISTNLNYRGQVEIHDKLASVSNIKIEMFEARDNNNAQFSDLKDAAGNDMDFESTTGSLFEFHANNAIAIDEPSVDIFKDLADMITAVRNGSYRGAPDSSDPRTTGIQGALKRIDHLADHINKQHTQIGSHTNNLTATGDRSTIMQVNVEELKKEIIGADIGETMYKFNQSYLAYQAMLSATARIGQLSLLNYI